MEVYWELKQMRKNLNQRREKIRRQIKNLPKNKLKEIRPTNIDKKEWKSLVKKIMEEKLCRESTYKPSQYENIMHARYSTLSMGYTYKSGKLGKIGIEFKICKYI